MSAFGLVVLFSLLGAAPPTPSSGLRSAQWRSVVTVVGTDPDKPLEEAEIWLSGSRMRIEEGRKGTPKTIVLKTGTEVYVWVEGQSSGTRMNLGLAAKSGRPPHDYARRIEEIRSRGKRIGAEKVDGYSCDVFEFGSLPPEKGTYWLATELQGFPVKAIVERSMPLPYRSEANRTQKLEYHNTRVRIPGSVSEVRFALPTGVEFQDLTDLFLNKGRPPR
ncbi:MAG TPA: hypothetical protein VMR54_10920 [Thermoanaerobaculia bacterium]|nr:hypothetical protein [Thermoanaerobaculia bacterium]